MWQQNFTIEVFKQVCLLGGSNFYVTGKRVECSNPVFAVFLDLSMATHKKLKSTQLKISFEKLTIEIHCLQTLLLALNHTLSSLIMQDSESILYRC